MTLRSAGIFVALFALSIGSFNAWLAVRDSAVRTDTITEIAEVEDRQTRAKRNELEQIKKAADSLPPLPGNPDRLQRLCEADPYCDS